MHALTTSTVGVSLLQSLTDYIVVGATPKIVHAAGSTGFDVDAGVMIAVRRVRLGAVARNLTSPAFANATAGEPGEIELSRDVRMGAAWGSGWPGHSRVMVSVDGDLTSRATPLGDRRDVAAGVETWWRDRRLGLRGGVRRSMIGASRAAVAAGVSAGLRPGMLAEAHVVVGQRHERGWSVGVRAGF
ncbi:MAG TPA: conjugal transfer protein TraF [Vicinamibacterales bacterium]|nr:conjugal transfer protein TraF [Vicinamibacterales bacterium]